MEGAQEEGVDFTNAEVKIEAEEEDEEEPPSGERTCVICLCCCGSSCSEEELSLEGFVELKTGVVISSEREACLSKHLFCVFFLRHLLHYPREECEKLLATLGESPGDWCSVCGECACLIQNAFRAHQKVLALEKELAGMREKLSGRLMESLEGAHHEDYSPGENKDWEESHWRIREYFKHFTAITRTDIIPNEKPRRGRPKGRKKEKKNVRKLKTRNRKTLKTTSQVPTDDNETDGIYIPEFPDLGNGDDDPCPCPDSDFEDPLYIPEEVGNQDLEDDEEFGEVELTQTEFSIAAAYRRSTSNVERPSTSFPDIIGKIHLTQKKVTGKSVPPDRVVPPYENKADKGDIPHSKSKRKRTRRTSPEIVKACLTKNITRSSTPNLTSRRRDCKRKTTPSYVEDMESSPSPSKEDTDQAETKSDYKCQICGRDYARKINYEKHLKLHEKFRKTTCKVCIFPFETRKALHKHMVEKHGDKSQPLIYKCAHCDYTATKLRTWYNHKSTKHPESKKAKKKPKQKTYQCDLCDYSGNRYSAFYYHRNSHVEFKSGSGEKNVGEEEEIVRKDPQGRTKPLRKFKDFVNIFKCPECCSAFRNKRSLLKHSWMHRKYAKTSCKICNYPLVSEVRLKGHMRKFHYVKPSTVKVYKCTKCSFSSTRYSTYYSHKRVAHEVSDTFDAFKEPPSEVARKPWTPRSKSNLCPLYCKICKRAFINRERFQNHLKLHDQHKATTCSVCKYPFVSEELLTKHFEKRHKEKVYSCDKCSFTANSFVKVYYHKNSHIELQSSPQTGNQQEGPPPVEKKKLFHRKSATPQNSFFCHLCKHGFSNNLKLRHHQKDHVRYKDTSCKTCNYPCASEEKLKGHTRMYHYVKPDVVKSYKCPHCDYSSTKYSRLFLHKHRHAIVDNFDESDETLTEQGKVRCKLCGEVDSRRGMFKHMKAAHNVGNGVQLCHYCHKTYTSPSQLRVHIRRVHENDVLYTCEKCGKGFMLKNRYETHIAKCVHGKKGTLVCEACGNIYACRDTLRMHLKKFHPEVYENQKQTTEQFNSYLKTGADGRQQMSQ